MFQWHHRRQVTVTRGLALEMEIRWGRFQLSLLEDTEQLGLWKRPNAISPPPHSAPARVTGAAGWWDANGAVPGNLVCVRGRRWNQA